MPADELYWNPMDLDSEESIPYPNQYIDPWDLENYAYIRQHLDSVDLNSDPSSLGEPQETSAFYYIPAKPVHIESSYTNTIARKKEETNSKKNESYYYAPLPIRYDSLINSEHGTANYAAIEEVEVHDGFQKKKKNSIIHDKQSRTNYDLESMDMFYDDGSDDIYGINEEKSTMHIYETNKAKHTRTLRNMTPVVRRLSKSRRYSFSVGEFEYDKSYRSSHRARYGDENGYMSSSDYCFDTYGPVYDDRLYRPKPNFQLSNYGHLQIDYSCNWNNLNKYIYN